MIQRLRGFVWIPILTFLFLWAELVRSLSAFWSTNPQYAYGWTVPALALFLLWESWITRPAPAPVHRHIVASLLIGIFCICLLPTRLLLETTPDWRFAQWSLAAIVVGLSLCAVYLTGGKSWLVHFAFPIAFIFVSVPWPTQTERSLIQALSQWVSSLTVEGLNLCSVPAIKHGNLIEISTGTVGVEEACSGVRSFQATLMAALFLGQLWNFSLRSRALLVGAGVVFAFICNVVRALLLSFVAEKHGLAAIEKWHDPAGFTILGISFVGLLGLALWLRPKSGRSLTVADGHEPRNLPTALVVTLAVWVAFVAIGNEMWYRSAPVVPSAWWRVEWPEKQPGFTEIPLTPAVLLMKFDHGRQARWREDDGSVWTMFHFRWLPGLATSRIVTRWHNPDICLTAAGFKRVAEYEPDVFRKGDIDLVFRTYRFDAEGRKTFVFFCVWEDRKEPGAAPAPSEEWTPASRWRAVLQRKRQLGQQTLEIAINGLDNVEDARAAFDRRIAAMVFPDSIVPADVHPTDATATTAR